MHISDMLTGFVVGAPTGAVITAIVTTRLARRRERHEDKLEDKKQAHTMKVAIRRERFEQEQEASKHIVAFVNAVNTFMFTAVEKLSLLTSTPKQANEILHNVYQPVEAEAKKVRHWAPDIAHTTLDIEKACLMLMVEPPEWIEADTPVCRGWYSHLSDQIGKKIVMFEAVNMNHR